MAERSSALVTILFTDLVGSTGLLARAGDEEAIRRRRGPLMVDLRERTSCSPDWRNDRPQAHQVRPDDDPTGRRGRP